MTQTPPKPCIMDSDDQLAAMKRSLTELGVSLDRIIAQKDRYRKALDEIGRKTTDYLAASIAAEALKPQ